MEQSMSSWGGCKMLGTNPVMNGYEQNGCGQSCRAGRTAPMGEKGIQERTE